MKVRILMFLLIVDWLCVSLRDTCGLGDLQTPSDSSHSACRHPSDPGCSDRCQHNPPLSLTKYLSFPHAGSVYCVLVVAIERYFSVCRPFEQKVVSSPVTSTLCHEHFLDQWTDVHRQCCCILLYL